MKMSNLKKLLALLLALVMVFALAACGETAEKPAEEETETTEPETETTEPETTEPETETTEPETTEPEAEEEEGYKPSSIQLLNGKEYGVDADYISLYDKFGKEASIADVEEDPETGLAYFNAPDGNKYELGLDFLTMAMVYNTSTEGTDFDGPGLPDHGHGVQHLHRRH